MNISPTDNLFSYSVSSESGLPDYNVDLLAENGAGRCDCKQWQFRVSPALAKGEKKMCKHISRSLIYLAQSVVNQKLAQMAQEEAQSDREPTRYEALATEFKLKHPICGVCHQKPTEDVHHSRGRLGSLLCDQEWWVPVCRVCHDWIGSNPNAARELTWNGIPVLCENGQWNSPPAE